jgi:stearoyl-CoA desaturase (delta-9 desaturase)
VSVASYIHSIQCRGEEEYRARKRLTAVSNPKKAINSEHADIMYPSAIPFVLVHLAYIAALWTGITWRSVWICAVLYWLRIFAIGAGYHRYFSHRAYSTSRAFQFALAVLSQSTAQKSVLWWAAKHRHHHLHSDTELDVHSPRRDGFFYSHLGWIFARKHDATDLLKVADFARYPELMWLHRHELVWSTVLVYHATFCINSLAHVQGRKRYITGDDSRNNWLLALFTMGEGWHNNHHAYQSSVRQGFRWWEIDPTYYILKGLSWVRLVSDLKTPPDVVLRNEHRLGSRVIGRAAAQLAASFNPDHIAAIIGTTIGGPALSVLENKLAATQQRAAEVLTSLHLPHLPTRHEILARGMAMFSRTPSMDDIVDQAHELILDAIGARLCANATSVS